MRVTLDDGSEHPGVASLGVRPTFDPPQELLEAHLFDFDGDLYGRTIEVALHAFIREEQKFGDVEALVAQMREDEAAARKLLAFRHPGRESGSVLRRGCVVLRWMLKQVRMTSVASAASPLRPASMADAPDKPDYRSTVFLPRTDFPMKAGLPQKEPAILARWESEDLYGQIRKSRAGREKFIFHDGPPYANGDIHIGHALNQTLKDMVVRTQTLLGKDAPYVPGWDCHGLPIEWKVEEQYRKKKLNKDEVPVREFRAECRAYAQHWVDVQREQMKRLGALPTGTIPI